MTISAQQFAATLFFTLAVLHTFLVARFQAVASQFPEGSVGENVFHLLGEVEVVFGFWAGVYLIYLASNLGFPAALEYLESRNFTEPAFVFVIMSVCSTQPILRFASMIIEGLSRLLPLQKSVSFFIVVLSVGPILGSFITEPAAMTVTALILFERFYSKGISRSLMYATLGVLFVNVSVGGVLTPYAAPPVIMVASKWNWDLSFMFFSFGWKGALACVLSALWVTYRFRAELAGVDMTSASKAKMPFWIIGLHLCFLALVVLAAHHMIVFIGLFLFFLGLVAVTQEYQKELNLKSGLLVAFFLGGLIVLGGPQSWWVEPAIKSLDSTLLYLGSIGLTAIIDNAALTYLGAQVPDIAEAAKYYLVAGAVVGGGLTVIANAPNPAGFGILNPAFGSEGISPLGLFKHALLPTLIAGLCFFLF